MGGLGGGGAGLITLSHSVCVFVDLLHASLLLKIGGQSSF